MAQLREIGTWDEAYLEELPIGEFDWLDFKKSAWLDNPKWIEQTSLYLSAFANYDGGYLIIGVPDPKTLKKIQCDGGVDRSFKNGLKDWAEDKFPTLVDPPLQRINVQEVIPQTSLSSIKAGHCVLAVYVPPSEAAPHQALDRKYYTRLGSKLSALGHRAVMDIIGRRRHPNIKIKKLQVLQMKKHEWGLFLTARNESPILARHAQITVDLPIRFKRRYVLQPDEFRMRTDAGMTVVRINFHAGGLKGPLFPRASYNFQQKLEVIDTSPHSSWETVPTIDHIECRIYADEMPFKELKFPIDDVVDLALTQPFAKT